MITLKNFSQYEPEYKQVLFDAIFLESEDGLDWYYHMSRFQSDTLKFCFDKNNIIRSFSYQADKLFPLGMSVSEVKKLDVPEGLNINGEWMFSEGKIISVPFDYIQEAEQKRMDLMKCVSEKIDLLVSAEDDGDITDEEKAILARLREYRSALRRLDLSKAPDVQWPEDILNVA
ncbi:TPA: tail fiber assembly protein [Enterobacter asburiae]|nr:tail fiber assembly protein [Enterobacter asburiae]